MIIKIDTHFYPPFWNNKLTYWFVNFEKLLHIIKKFKVWNGKGTKAMWTIKDNPKKL